MVLLLCQDCQKGERNEVNICDSVTIRIAPTFICLSLTLDGQFSMLLFMGRKLIAVSCTMSLRKELSLCKE